MELRLLTIVNNYILVILKSRDLKRFEEISRVFVTNFDFNNKLFKKVLDIVVLV